MQSRNHLCNDDMQANQVSYHHFTRNLNALLDPVGAVGAFLATQFGEGGREFPTPDPGDGGKAW